MMLSLEVAVPIAAGQTRLLGLTGFDASTSLEVAGVLANARWNGLVEELQLMLLQPLDAETTYTAVITNITLPSNGLEANSSACRISRTEIERESVRERVCQYV